MNKKSSSSVHGRMPFSVERTLVVVDFRLFGRSLINRPLSPDLCLNKAKRDGRRTVPSIEGKRKLMDPPSRGDCFDLPEWCPF
ncbi:hypothetical protein CEXT_663071 [Caerostris extrusa]|uniref:Uncharacterized protein n=1 Tax=Caerostris extrusa TaxID=172846 RepID=A0AAV4R8U2_CAEEX|nr:hypothetical protein CEXT_663071 [Caerostris extrusa]